MTAYTTIDSPIGELLLTGEGGALTRLYMSPFDVDPAWEHDPAALAGPARQLAEYFDGERTEFELELSPAGTAFQQRVWALLLEIPYGETTTYGALADELGNPRTVRAVGLANGRNSLSILVPCHRVVGASGALTGYAGGVARKRWLLDHERRVAAAAT